jgi:hypothetical protein
MPLPWRKPRNDKIFINYRRDDAGGFAGRLSDTLTAHFGDERVFRDVTGIDYGHDFERVIDQRVAESCAIVVLIGDKWASIANADGQRRLDDPADYVCREIEAALDSGVTVVPVLIGDASMPRRDELPERLAGLTRRNAITITDERWDFDVARLARVLAIDVPGSVAQQRLDLMRAAALALLAAAAIFTTLAFCAAIARLMPPGDALRLAGFSPLVSAIPFIALLLAGTLALTAGPAIEQRRRNYAWAAAALAAAGTLGPFVYYTINNDALPTWSLIANFGAATIVITLVLVLIGLAGFRAK